MCVTGTATRCTTQAPDRDPPRQTSARSADEQRAAATSPPSDSEAAQEAPSTDIFQGTTNLVERQRPGLDPVVLQNVRTGRQQDFDRVVFEFSTSMVPGYRIEYVDGPVHQCASDEVLKVRGAGTLLVRLSPAQAHTDAGTMTVARQRQQPALPNLKEVRLSCDFEGDVSWVLGVAKRTPYRVSELSKPTRLVVDIQH
jgi:hypothetical protein